MTATEKKKVAEILFVVILLLAAFTAVSTFIKSIDVADVPEELRPHWALIASFFTSGLGALLAAIGWNVYGYVTAYYRSGKVEQYDSSKLYMTLAKFAGFFTTVDTILAQLALIYGESEIFWIISLAAKMVFVVVVALISEMKRLQTPMATGPPPIPTAAG